MNFLEVRKLLSQGEIEQAAKLVNYESPKLQEYLNASRTDENTYEYLQDLGDEITKELLYEMDRISTVQ